ncbi:hypothetical protein P691DRAFT_788627 [Macrolepiota fuliginosa MF-IS2]|uniref:Uncharacterized protein n=1 Tax=Macrolepiota fuliginosa MF-IS2 TaxID=1400762 RepID=A0A9P5X3Z8_9AGAR|nr:hypothetical protein P691DRAFT_788627 [Macrolepiota fuliginosa MF-IS2]
MFSFSRLALFAAAVTGAVALPTNATEGFGLLSRSGTPSATGGKRKAGGSAKNQYEFQEFSLGFNARLYTSETIATRSSISSMPNFYTTRRVFDSDDTRTPFEFLLTKVVLLIYRQRAYVGPQNDLFCYDPLCTPSSEKWAARRFRRVLYGFPTGGLQEAINPSLFFEKHSIVPDIRILVLEEETFKQPRKTSVHVELHQDTPFSHSKMWGPRIWRP